jgi:Phage capsid family
VPSFWYDLLLEREADERALLAFGRDSGDPQRLAADDELAEARERLRAVREFDRFELDRLAQRDLTTSGFVPAAGAPMFIAEMFAAAARARAGLAAALPQQPLPQAGDHIEVPRLSGGAAVAVVASENAVVQETDPTSALASSNKALISGQVDVSRQLLEFSRPGIDEVLSLDLGNDTGLKIDQQLIAGTNANGQTLGLANVASINTVTYTSATPIAAALISKIWNASSSSPTQVVGLRSPARPTAAAGLAWPAHRDLGHPAEPGRRHKRGRGFRDCSQRGLRCPRQAAVPGLRAGGLKHADGALAGAAVRGGDVRPPAQGRLPHLGNRAGCPGAVSGRPRQKLLRLDR